MADSDYYTILEVTRTATKAQISKNFRKLSLKYHPDRNQTEEGQEMMKKITEAYTVLKDDNKRKEYDIYGKQGPPKFNEYTGGFGPFGGYTQMHKPHKKQYPTVVSVDVTLEEMYIGGVIKREIEVNQFCMTCNRTGFADKVFHVCKHCNGAQRVPEPVKPGCKPTGKLVICRPCFSSGKSHDHKHCEICKSFGNMEVKKIIDVKLNKFHIDDEYLLYPRMGDQIEGGYKDLVVNLNIKKHPLFELERGNLILKMKLTLAEAICGFSKKMPFLDGTELIIEYDKLLRDKDIKQVPGKGWNGNSLFVVFSVEETTLLKKQKDAIFLALTGKKFNAKMSGKNPLEDHKPRRYEKEHLIDSEEDGPVQCRQS